MEYTLDSHDLRIVSLLPAATDICKKLGIELVGVTHECDHDNPSILRVTKDGLKENSSQRDIHEQVKSAIQIETTSLYPILEDVWLQANPSLVLTQDLCSVCGPSSSSVSVLNGTDTRVVSLSPNNLDQVIATFMAVANACDVEERGIELQNNFRSQLKSIQTVLSNFRTASRPKIMLLEWLDPPFDAGHWIPEMIEYAGAKSAIDKKEIKSVQIQWQQIYDAKPDIVVIACCGFDLDRNHRDAMEVGQPYLMKLSPKTRIYVADGNQFFARPGPKLTGGVAILAQIAHPASEAVIASFDFAPSRGQGWNRIYIQNNFVENNNLSFHRGDVDVEDSAPSSYARMHREACSRGEHTYVDPSTGYQVFTELAHKARGKCCGSGCRHCPFNHENVKDKAGHIKQPAFLHNAVDQGHPIKVLFFSGGKDSFLTIRALVRQTDPMQIVLLTTFDAIHRVVAHQDIVVRDIQRQAQHLDLSLVGIPLDRASGINYIEYIQQGLSLIEKKYGRAVDALVFGDLHLESIRQWREECIGRLGYKMEFPLWHVSYDFLRQDLIDAKVPCVISASTVPSVIVGAPFTTCWSASLEESGEIDAFGENGEFHTLVQVWDVNRSVALGL